MLINMTSKSSLENLALLTALQMLGFIILEVIVWILLTLGVIPPMLMLQSGETFIFQINTAYIVIAGLMVILVSGFWLAVLTELLGVVEIKDMDIKLW